MQFHLNGFQPGDPSIQKPNQDSEATFEQDSLPKDVDVLIVGSGPAGLTLAAFLSGFSDISTRLIEAKSGPLSLGQADGVACRTMEMFQAFGFAHHIQAEAYWVNEVAFWKPDPERPSHILRSGLVKDTEEGLSEFPHVILNQARVHDYYLNYMLNSPNRMRVNYSRSVVDVKPEPHSNSVHVKVERNDSTPPQTEHIRAKYVVGCDGARSIVRQSMGLTLQGDSANQAWGVMDVLAVTDFPDIRKKAAIQSANEGNILIIPREGGYLVRFYVEMDKLNPNERVANKKITIEHVIAAAKRIMQPYQLDVQEVVWWSVYEIGQRICDRYDNRQEQSAPSVFIAGDACHTHSPKAGQGMNFSMQDSFNLGWKLSLVLRGLAQPELLQTYSDERQLAAQDLINFDREWAAMFSDKPKSSEEDGGVDPKAFQEFFVRQGRFTAGTETQYRQSMICGSNTWQDLAKGFQIGMRFHSAPVIRQADGKRVELGHVARANDCFRLYIFAGHTVNFRDPANKLTQLFHFLAHSDASPIQKYTPAHADIDSVISCYAIFQQHHNALTTEELPSLLRPQKGQYGLIDYEKVFCPDHERDCDIFSLRDIDRDSGCIVVVRPDQYIGHVLPVDASDELALYFANFMIQQ